MQQLAFIRLLYLQAVSQSDLPEPLKYTSVLTFHDTVELFLVLAVEHLGAPLPRRDPNFLQYWEILRATADFPDGVELSGQPGMDRLNRYRNNLKHAGAWPGSDAVDDAQSSASSFLEDNTPRVFDVQFAAVDMADVVPREDTRRRLKAAVAAENAGNRTEAMGQLQQAFAGLLREQVGSGFGTRFGFGTTVTDQPFLSITQMIRHAASGAKLPQDRHNAQQTAERLDGPLPLP